MKPLYALHKDHSGKILGASSFSDDYSLRSWVGKLDLRDGDAISFGEVTERAEFDNQQIGPLLTLKVDGLEWSIRTSNCLRNADVIYIGDLVQKTEDEVLRMPNTGRKSLNEIKEVLGAKGLHLGMQIEWDRPIPAPTFLEGPSNETAALPDVPEKAPALADDQPF